MQLRGEPFSAPFAYRVRNAVTRGDANTVLLNTMNRRTLLYRSGLSAVALVALSGCTEETLEEAETKPPFVDIDEEELELPIEQQADVVEEGVLRADGAAIEEPADVESFLAEQGLPVEDVSETEKLITERLEVEREDVDRVEESAHGEGLVLELEFVQPDRLETGFLYSVGLVAGGYAALIEAGFDGELLEATVLDSAGESFGSFHVLTAWAEEYNEGQISARVYGSKPWAASKSE